MEFPVLSTSKNDSIPINPHVLTEVILKFNEEEDGYLRVALLTADDRPLPYFLIQIFHTPTPTNYVLNYGVYPNLEVLHQIRDGLLTTFECLLMSQRMALRTGTNPYRVANGASYLEMLDTNQLILDKHISTKIDAAIRTWLP